MPEEGLKSVLQLLDTFGSLGLMGTLVWLFMTGKILPRSVVDRLLDAERENSKHLVREILEKLKEK